MSRRQNAAPAAIVDEDDSDAEPEFRVQLIVSEKSSQETHHHDDEDGDVGVEESEENDERRSESITTEAPEASARRITPSSYDEFDSDATPDFSGAPVSKIDGAFRDRPDDDHSSDNSEREDARRKSSSVKKSRNQRTDYSNDDSDREVVERKSSSVKKSRTPRTDYSSDSSEAPSLERKPSPIKKTRITNPILLEKRMQHQLQQQSLPRKPPANDDLWSDVSEEEAEKPKKRSRPRSSSKYDRPRQPRKKASRNSDRPAQSRKRPAQTSRKRKSEPEEEEEFDCFLPSFPSMLRAQEEADDMLHPEFENPKFPPEEKYNVPLQLTLKRDDESTTAEVPASINRYLKDYQRIGVGWLFLAVAQQHGCILGDDMGLGKTVQVIALLTALLKKHGTNRDAVVLDQRRRFLEQKIQREKHAMENAMLYGHQAPEDIEEDSALTMGEQRQLGISPADWAPILILVPPSVVENWLNELKCWGHFGVGAFQGKNRSRALERVQQGLDEILVTGSAQFSLRFKELMKVQWRLVVIDEFHEYKNCKSQKHMNLAALKYEQGCTMIGLSGTIMPNDHRELHSLVNLVRPGYLGDWKEFERHVSKPIKFGRLKTALQDAVERSQKRVKELHEKLKPVLLERKKETELKDELPMKDEKVVFCELSPVQKRIYSHVMSLPDYVLLKEAKGPCECGVNQQIFMDFKRLKTKKEQVAFLRRNDKNIVQKRDCCHEIPWNPKRDEEGEPKIDPKAALWKSYHPDCEPCEMSRCPYCILLPALQKLYKICSHAALLQLDERLDTYAEGSEQREKLERDLAFAKVALPPDVLSQMPGGAYVREDGIMDDFKMLSGKMQILDQMLATYSARGDRVLLFSYSTKTLGLIQNYARAEGYSFLRIDGTTPTSKRQALVDEYQKDETIFLFLLSTKACGLGLNITAGNVVIVFDVNWNPSLDEQAQDRSYRIGQKNDVQVVRLVSRGTVEELMYIRQVYKVQLKQETLGYTVDEAPQAARLFRGVAGDKTRKGELFGAENLLKYKDGSFMADIWKTSARKRLGGVQVHDTRDLSNAVSNMSVEQVERIGENEVDDTFAEAASRGVESNALDHADFLRQDRGEAALQEGDEAFEEEMGGISQMVHDVLEKGEIEAPLRPPSSRAEPALSPIPASPGIDPVLEAETQPLPYAAIPCSPSLSVGEAAYPQLPIVTTPMKESNAASKKSDKNTALPDDTIKKQSKAKNKKAKQGGVRLMGVDRRKIKRLNAKSKFSTADILGL